MRPGSFLPPLSTRTRHEKMERITIPVGQRNGVLVVAVVIELVPSVVVVVVAPMTDWKCPTRRHDRISVSSIVQVQRDGFGQNEWTNGRKEREELCSPSYSLQPFDPARNGICFQIWLRHL